MPQDQTTRDLIARMKLIPIPELIEGNRLLFAEDSIVRGTQLKGTIQRLYDIGAKEVHMRPACPPLVYSCKFLNFSRSRSELDLAARNAIREIEAHSPVEKHSAGAPAAGTRAAGAPAAELIAEYTNSGSERYNAMVEFIRDKLKLTSLKYQSLPDLIESIGLPKNKLCTYCWDGTE